MKTFGQSWIVHLLGPAAVGWFVYMAWKCQHNFGQPIPHPLQLHFLFWICCGFTLVVLYLYLATCHNRYDVMEEGLQVRRFFLFRSRFYPWNQISRISWMPRLKTIVVHGPDQMIFFSSTDCFPALGEFLGLLHQRSNCSLSPRLRKAMYPEQSA